MNELVLDEEMCFELPIIATDQVAAYNLIKHGQNGFVYAAGDIIKSLKNCIEVILKDDDLRRDMGKASLALIERWGLRRISSL